MFNSKTAKSEFKLTPYDYCDEILLSHSTVYTNEAG